MVEREFEKRQYFLSEFRMKEYFKQYLNRDKGFDWNVFILINRKGYWDYKIFYPDGYNPKGDNRVIVSDRFLDKLPKNRLIEFLKDKRVIIYDDSLTNGGNLFSYFLLCKSFGAKEVQPVVYALNTSFPSEKSLKIMRQEASEMENQEYCKDHSVDEMMGEFISLLSYELLLGAGDIDKMSVWQTMLYQKNVSPLVMDLPILNHKKDQKEAGEKEDRITLDWSRFQELCSARSKEWQFVENRMNGWGENVEASYFQFNSRLVDERLDGLFHDFVVKCKYQRKGDKVDVVFTPFAIVKSNSIENVYHNFRLLYRNTQYEKYICGILENREGMKALEEDAHLCKNIFRAVIFRLSDYIGHRFQKYVKDILDIDLEYDWKIMKDNFEEEFISTQEELYKSYNEAEFEKLILQCKVEADIYPFWETVSPSEGKRRATQERVNIYIRKRICRKKRTAGESKSAKERIYIFEAIKSELKSCFTFEDERELRRMLTAAILLFLETNSFSNYILVDKDTHILYRGFRYGENSEIFLHEDLWYFYAYLFAYYMESDVDDIKTYYDVFMNWLANYLQREGKLGIWITEDGFLFLRDYFGEMSNEELRMEILRRRYLLECRTYGEEDVRRNIIRKAAAIVQQWERA